MKGNQHGISALVCQTSISGEITDGVVKCRLFPQEEAKTNRKQKNPKRTSGTTGCDASGSETRGGGQSGYGGASTVYNRADHKFTSPISVFIGSHVAKTYICFHSLLDLKSKLFWRHIGANTFKDLEIVQLFLACVNGGIVSVRD